MIDPHDSEARRQRLEKARRMVMRTSDEPTEHETEINLPFTPTDWIHRNHLELAEMAYKKRKDLAVTLIESLMIHQVVIRSVLKAYGMTAEEASEWQSEKTREIINRDSDDD